MINLGRDICGNLEVSTRKEWLETNGLGGYACGTVAGMHTRSYHTLLAAALEPPLHRVTSLTQLEEYVLYGGQKYYISTNHYRDTVSPKGYLNLESFRLDPFPIFTYRLADQVLEKRIFMSYGHNLTWIVYRLLTPVESDLILTVRPLFNFRDHHLRRRERCFANTHHDLENHVIRLLPDRNIPPLNIYHNAVSYEHSAQWYQNLFFREEKRRGLECEEDWFSPGVISFRLETMEPNFLAATTATLENPEPEAAANAEIIRRRELCSAVPAGDAFGQTLALAADQFLVKRAPRGEAGEGLTVIAGYPWLGECGRDAMVALPGLTLATQRRAEAQALLQTYAGFCSEGMLPCHFAEEQGEPLYNTVDAALWFLNAVHLYRISTGDTAFVRKNLWPVMEEIIDYYIKGTRYHIRMDDDGLINMPEEGAQLTWMDAQVGDWVVTPRSGKPVEVAALWYNGLCIMRDLAAEFKESAGQERYASLAQKAFQGFHAQFWNEKNNCCFDRIEDHFQDSSIRPNQLLALSLPYPLVTGDQAKRVLSTVRQELGTSFGLRTLNRDNENYKGTYDGDVLQREGAAFQGTVWPWLIGTYADALWKAYGDTKSVREELTRFIKPFEAHLFDVGLGTISEMFDGDPPHAARGCIARAWSVSEILRIHLELQRA